MIDEFITTIQPAIDEELIKLVSSESIKSYPGLEDILRYHLGWENQERRPAAAGKRIRPLLVLLAAAAVGGEWRRALPSAAAVELLHNFSLIHDDIEDQSPLRRGRITVWQKWGIPLAINAGDAMYALAFQALEGLKQTVDGQTELRSTQILTETCVKLTGGQHLDITLEHAPGVDLDTYFAMIAGKTAALLSCSLRLGAIAGGASAKQEVELGKFGQFLGLGFQVWDDWLGIWGIADEIGKSVESDLVAGKKTLPVIFGLEHGGCFAERWRRGAITVQEVPEISSILEEEGARAYTEARANELTNQAIQALHAAECVNEAAQDLESLAYSLLKRKN